MLIGINAAALALMANVTIQLGQNIFVEWYFILIFFISLLGILKYKINSAFFILGGILLGLFLWFRLDDLLIRVLHKNVRVYDPRSRRDR